MYSYTNTRTVCHSLSLTPAAFLMIRKGSPVRRPRRQAHTNLMSRGTFRSQQNLPFPLTSIHHSIWEPVVVHGNGKHSCRRFSPTLGDPGTLRRAEGCQQAAAAVKKNGGTGKKVKRARRTNSLRGSMCGDSTLHEALLLPDEPG